MTLVTYNTTRYSKTKIILFFYKKYRKKKRYQRSKLVRKLDWDGFCQRDPEFVKRTLRMPLQSFNKLVNLLHDTLKKNETQGSRRGGALPPHLRVFACIRWLAGGSYLDICNILGISKALFYSITKEVINAIIMCNDYEINNIFFPKSEADCEEAAADFSSISKNGAMNVIVGAVDGYLLKCIAPSSKEVGNVRSYYSGNYKCHGVNVQAACDAHTRFTFIGVMGPGVMSDRDAIQQGRLHSMIEELPLGYAVIGDAAYEPTDRLVALFGWDAAKVPRNDNFNFYGSQCRIRIEMAFGVMQQKWGVLQRPWRGRISQLRKLVVAIARLHNYTINERLTSSTRKPPSESNEEMARARSYNMPTIINDDEEEKLKSLEGQSYVRACLVDRVEQMYLKRPRMHQKSSS